MKKNKLRMKDIISYIEIIGNKFPHPFWIFIDLSIVVIILSFVLKGKAFQYFEHGNITSITINNLLEVNYLLDLLKNLPENFAYFKPLSIVILILMGVSVFQESGAVSAIIRATLKKTPTKYLITVVAIVGVNSNIASDAGVIIIPAMCGALFQALGLNPWLGIIVGYASADGGFTLNMFVAGTDVILSGITSSVTDNIGINSNIHPFDNWYFMITASALIVFLTVIVSEKFTKKILNDFDNNMGMLTAEEIENLSKREKEGLRYFIYSNIAYFLILIGLGRYFLRYNSSLADSMQIFYDHIVGLIFLYFIISGVAFGLRAGTLNSLGDLPSLFGSGIMGSKSFIITALPASVFVKILNDSNFGFWVANTISNILMSLRLPPLLLLIFFILLIGFLNLFITSGSVKWLFIAPLAIPIFTNLGFSPSMIQLSYRIGDTCTNIISPTEYYLPIIISLFESYKPDSDTKVGIGTVISLSMPYTIAYLLGLIILLLIWNFIGLPLGP